MSDKSNQAVCVKNVMSSTDLPNQLVIRKGRLVLKSNGKTPKFTFPEGMEVSVIDRASAVKALTNSRAYNKIKMFILSR